MSANQIVGRDNILSFMLAGNALFSLKSVKTGEHLTYRVKQSNKLATDMFYVLAGQSKDYIGDLSYYEGLAKFSERRDLRGNTRYLLPFKWFLHHMDSPQVEFFHAGRCGKCGRRLTDPTSITRGLGPECAQTFAHKHMKEMFA